ELSKLEKIAVGGWVKTFRQNKFVELNDGSCLQNLQVICTPNLLKEPEEINRGSSLIVSGNGVLTNLYFLTEHTSPSKLISDKAKIECQLPSAQPQTVLISDIDLNPTKIVWISPRTVGGKHVKKLIYDCSQRKRNHNHQEVLDRGKLFKQLQEINPYQANNVIDQVIEKLLDPQLDNQQFLNYLHSGVTIHINGESH
ncbi:877_t:CDS:2, partial [Racocetra persica]